MKLESKDKQIQTLNEKLKFTPEKLEKVFTALNHPDGDEIRYWWDETDRLEKELKETEEMAKLNSAVWKMDSDELKNERNALKKQLERSQGAHEKQVHHMSGEINRQINKVAEAEKERDVLNEQLARIGEALRSFDPSDESENYQYSFGLRKKALSSYDPKWIEGVKDSEGKKGLLCGFREAVDLFWGELPQDHKVWKLTAARDMELINLVNGEKPNQSREKRG